MKKYILFTYILRLASSKTTSSSTNTSSSSNGTTTETYEFGDSLPEDIRNIAYYLRQHKFNEYDRRYITDEAEASSSKSYFKSFPKPPLRSLHWEVHKHCEVSFLECVAYLTKRIKNTQLRRSDDTSVVMEDQKWFTVDFTVQIEQTDSECKKLWGEAEDRADPFEGPIERFQWRVTASYFMCWYTMKSTPELKHLDEPSCDNHANCFNPHTGPHNLDVRSNDSEPFNCARYSFCPDPCCPIFLLSNFEECWSSTENPCFAENHPGHQQCSFDILSNTEFQDIILNWWNVSCKCPYLGYRWSSLHGICVDIDECEENTDSCDSASEGCINLPGKYECACRWGYLWDPESKKCKYSEVLEGLILRKSSDLENEKDNATQSFFKRMYARAKERFSKSIGSKICTSFMIESLMVLSLLLILINSIL